MISIKKCILFIEIIKNKIILLERKETFIFHPYFLTQILRIFELHFNF